MERPIFFMNTLLYCYRYMYNYACKTGFIGTSKESFNRTVCTLTLVLIDHTCSFYHSIRKLKETITVVLQVLSLLLDMSEVIQIVYTGSRAYTQSEIIRRDMQVLIRRHL